MTLDAATLAPPNVIVLDLEMPVMTGAEALPGLRRAAPAARVIVFSSHAAAAECCAGADALDDFLTVVASQPI